MLGILCGLHEEAMIADKIPGVLVACSGARAPRARALVALLLEKGARRLISFGLAGGLTPNLAAGDVLLGTSVFSGPKAWEADAEWNQLFLDQMPTAIGVSVWASDRPIVTSAEKYTIYSRTGCFAVDMESHILAEAAARARIPFNIVRVVCDVAREDLPPAARVPLVDDGKVDMKGVWESVRKTPAQIPALMRLALANARAMRGLRAAAQAMKEIEP